MSKPPPIAPPRSARRNAPKRTDVNAIGLGSPVGLTQGTFNQNEMKVDASQAALLTFCTCNYAFAYTYIQPPGRWCPKTINDIIVGGAALLRSAQQCNLQSTATKPLTEAAVPRQISIVSHSVELAPVTGPELIGNLHLTAAAQRTHNIHNGLRKFFAQPASRRRGCLFRCEPVQLLVWRRGRIYYVFDACGRNAECEQRAYRGGSASLICLEALRNVVYLIEHMCSLRPHEFYTLSELRVVKVMSLPDAATTKPPCVDRNKPNDDVGYVVLNDHAAILHGSLTIGNQCFGATRNHQALATCCVAYVYSLMRPPNSWTSRTVDKVLLFGNQMYADCVRYDLPEEFTIRNIPPLITLGAFRAALRIMPFQHGGRLQHAIDPRASELQLALRQFFDEHRCALLQIEQRTWAAWRRADVYYLFDPYVCDAGGSAADEGAACVHMHSTLESLCALLYANLMRIAEKEVFYVHGLWARVMDRQAAGDEGEDDGNRRQDGDGISMNESIDSMFVPQLECKGVKVQALSERSKADCNLDSPSLSATQFIRPWHVIKAEMFGQQGDRDGASGPESVPSSLGSSISDYLSLDDDDDDGGDEEEDDGPNNDLGLTNDEFDRLTEAGLNYDDIRGYLALGHTPDEMIGWHKEGVSPDEVARLRAVGIDSLKDFRQLRKWGLSVDDCERMSALGIEAKQYAKLKKQGIDPDQMLETIARKDNLLRMRDQNLNRCQIDKLSKAGISAEEYEQATAHGLSFEEALHASEHGISADYFARHKEAGMSNVDIVRASQLGMDPAEYMAAKDAGQTDADIAHTKELEEFEELRKLGYQSDEERREYTEMKAADPTMTPQKYHEHKIGISEADTALAKELNMKPDEYMELTKKLSMSHEVIARVKEMEDQNALEKFGYTSDADKLEYARMKEADATMTPWKYHQMKADIAAALAASEAAAEVQQRPVQPPKVVIHVDDEVRPEPQSPRGDEKRPAKPAEDVRAPTVENLRAQSAEVQRSIAVEDVRSIPDEGRIYPSEEEVLARPSPLEIIGKRIDVEKDVSSIPDTEKDASIHDTDTLPESVANRTTLDTLDTRSSMRPDEGGSNQSLYGSAEDRKEAKNLDLEPSVSAALRTGPKKNMGVIKSAACTKDSFQKLFSNSFRVVDRVMVLNARNEPNCVAFRRTRGPPPRDQQYYLYEGCACNVQQIRRLVLDNATKEGYLQAYPNIDRMIERIIQRMRPHEAEAPRTRSVPSQQQAVQYAKKLLDERLESISAKFNDLMAHFHTLTREM